MGCCCDPNMRYLNIIKIAFVYQLGYRLNITQKGILKKGVFPRVFFYPCRPGDHWKEGEK